MLGGSKAVTLWYGFKTCYQIPPQSVPVTLSVTLKDSLSPTKIFLPVDTSVYILWETFSIFFVTLFSATFLDQNNDQKTNDETGVDNL